MHSCHEVQHSDAIFCTKHMGLAAWVFGKLDRHLLCTVHGFLVLFMWIYVYLLHCKRIGCLVLAIIAYRSGLPFSSSNRMCLKEIAVLSLAVPSENVCPRSIF